MRRAINAPLRRGVASLVEALVVIAIGSVVLGIAVTWLAAGLNATRSAQHRLQQSGILARLAEQFRDDVHAARHASVADPEAGGTLRLEGPGELAIMYRWEGERLVRIESHGGESHTAATEAMPSETVRREAFQSRGLRGVQFAIASVEDVPATLVQMTVELQQPGFDRPTKALAVEARLQVQPDRVVAAKGDQP